MTQKGFSLPKSTLTTMVDDRYRGDYKNVKSIYNNQYKGDSLNDKAGIAIRDFQDEMTPALKRMKATYLQNVAANCYPDHHISDDFTNEEQITMCRKEEYDRVFAEWNKQYHNHRASDMLRCNQCTADAGREVFALTNCYVKYLKDIKETNVTLKNIFVQERKEFL